MKLIIAILTLAIAPHAFAQTETQEFDGTSVHNFELENSSGDAVVQKADGNKIKIVATKKKFDKECTLEMKKSGSKVVVKVDQPFRKTCEVDFQIQLPLTIDMSLSNGSGDLEVNGTHGDIVYRVGSGNVKIKADPAKIDGRSGAGKLEARGSLTDVKILTGSGDTKLFYTKAPTSGEIDIKSGNGDAEITLPKDSKLLSDSTIGAGKFYNEFGDSKDAKFKVYFKAGAGSLKILKATN